MPDSALVILLQVLSGGRRDGELFFLNPDAVVFGRRHQEPAADVLFAKEDLMVSNRHGSLVRKADGYEYRDESKFGTYLLAAEGLGPKEAPGKDRNGRIESLFLPVGAVVGLQLGQGGPICRLMIGRALSFSRYLLVGRLGEGGMGTVYLAWEPALSRLVVLKWVRQVIANSVEAEGMLRDEACISAKLEHGNAATVYEVNRERGVLYIAMEYLRGITLTDLARQVGRLKKRLPPDLCAALVYQACLGLHAAHRAQSPTGKPLGIVHRDVSPSNIMVTSQGTVKVIDFGVARARGRLGATLHSLQTKEVSLVGDARSGRIVGNPAYMSPEHIAAPVSVDARSDVFSAGVVLYELCVGGRLFYRGDRVEDTMEAVLRCEVPELQGPEFPEGLSGALSQALQRNQDERQSSAGEFGRQLHDVVRAAGGRFFDQENIPAYLRELGVQLCGRLPAPLLELPAELAEERPQRPVSQVLPQVAPTPWREPEKNPDALAVLHLPLGTDSASRPKGPNGQPLPIAHLALAPFDAAEPLHLPFFPLFLHQNDEALDLRVDKSVPAENGRRMELYRETPSASTHCLRHDLPYNATGRIYVGHHRGTLQEIHVAAAFAEAGVSSLSLPELGLVVVPVARTRRLIALYTDTHLVCITVGADG